MLASHSPQQLWHLYLPFSRKLGSQLNNLYSAFIYYQSALSAQDEGRDVYLGNSDQGGLVFFMGDIIQLQILIYGREPGCDEQITAPTRYSNFCFQEAAFRTWFVLHWKWNYFFVGEWVRMRGLSSFILFFFLKEGYRIKRSHYSSILFFLCLISSQHPVLLIPHFCVLSPCYWLYQKVNQVFSLYLHLNKDWWLLYSHILFNITLNQLVKIFVKQPEHTRQVMALKW